MSQFYTPMNLHYSQTEDRVFNLVTKFYTSMNLHCSQTAYQVQKPQTGFIPLWIYIALKRMYQMYQMNTVLYLYEFTLLSNLMLDESSLIQFYTSMNLHYSQTNVQSSWMRLLFYTSMNLHYSQTALNTYNRLILFYTSMNLHYSQT